MGRLNQRAFPGALGLCAALLHCVDCASADVGKPHSVAPSSVESLAAESHQATAPSTAPSETTGPTESWEARDERQTPDEQQARAAFQRGDELYLEGDYEGSVSAFEEAYAKSGRIEMLFNLANAHERLGHYAEAALALRGYIPHSPEQHRPALERRLTRLSRLADERRASAQVQLDSGPAPSHAPAAWRPSLGVGVTTLGGAALLTGAGFALSTLGARKQLNALCTEGASGRICPPEAEPYLSRDRTYSMVADIALLAGAALATTGVVLILYQSKKSRSEVSVQPGIASVQLRGAF